MRPAPIPESLPSRFSVSDAKAAGLTKRRIRALDLERSVWGVRQRGPASTMRERRQLFATRLSAEVFFSHSTAALLLDAPLPREFEGARELRVSVTAPLPTPHAQGIRGHRLTVTPRDIATARDGLRTTSPARTWCELGSVLALNDLVAVGDFFLHFRLPITTITAIDAVLREWGHRRGTVNLHAARRLLSDRSESRPESKLRVQLALGRLPDPTVNHVIVETDSGRVMRTDLAFLDRRMVIEYQGDYHRTRHQWRKDMTRRARLEADGWYVMEVNADDLVDASELVARVHRVLARRR